MGGLPMDIVGNVVGNVTKIPHPYYPLEVEIVGYLANEWSVPALLGAFFGGLAVLFSATHFVVKKIQPRIPKSELFTVMWFVLTGSIHLFFEGYYALNQANMGGLQTFFGQLWKEYALSDSRYLTQDAFVLCMESVTAALWGPMSFIVAGMIATQHPLRHPLQAMVSTGQIYGLVLYYATCEFDKYYLGIVYSRPEAYYYWGYYFLMNFFWMVIPGILLYSSVSKTADAFRQLEKLGLAKKTT